MYANKSNPKNGAHQVTPQQRKQQFIDRGQPVKEWAKAHGFDSDMAAVYRVLNGQSPARRGKHHAIAVALGLKPSPSQAVQ